MELHRCHHVIRKEAGLFCRTSSSVRLWWELEEPKGPKGPVDERVPAGATRTVLSVFQGWGLGLGVES